MVAHSGVLASLLPALVAPFLARVTPFLALFLALGAGSLRRLNCRHAGALLLPRLRLRARFGLRTDLRLRPNLRLRARRRLHLRLRLGLHCCGGLRLYCRGGLHLHPRRRGALDT